MEGILRCPYALTQLYSSVQLCDTSVTIVCLLRGMSVLWTAHVIVITHCICDEQLKLKFIYSMSISGKKKGQD